MIRRFSPSDLSSIVDVLRQGGVLIFPTETSYGIGCDATNASAVGRVFAAKGRPEGKGTPLVVRSLESAERYVVFTDRARQLAKRYWPGALNIILSVRENMLAEQCQTDGTQSVRVSSDGFVQSLLQQFDRPIVATSANPSGTDALYEVSRVEEIFGERAEFIDGVVDVGPLPVVPASTTVRVTEEGIDVLRQGSVMIE